MHQPLVQFHNANQKFVRLYTKINVTFFRRLIKLSARKDPNSDVTKSNNVKRIFMRSLDEKVSRDNLMFRL